MQHEVVVVGSGPNGLAAAITMAAAGRSVLVREARDTPGGGARTVTIDGFRHDVCSAIHPLAAGSPCFRALPLARHGLDWVQPPAPVAHPLDDGSAVLLQRSTVATGEHLDTADRRTWARVFQPLVDAFEPLMDDVLGPIAHVPQHLLPLARFGALALPPATWLAPLLFRGPRARALFGGSACHAIAPLHWPATSAFGVLLSIAGHAVGWPFPRGGTAALTDALVAHLRSLGGELITGAPVDDVDELGDATVLFDVGVRELVRIAGHRLPGRYVRLLSRFRYGPGTFKLDWALSGPVPWRDPAVARAATVHLGGDLANLALSERAPWQGRVAERPFVIFAQPSLFDPSRAPAGRHTAYAYCHVPNGWDGDATERIEAQIERAAPGFRDLIVARHVTSPAAMQAKNANLVGGDLGGGANTPWQLLARPRLVDPYRVPGGRDWWLCSASTPPGGGVHGMCGWHAARRALAR